MNYFENCTSIEQIKNRYRELAKKHHPDRGGSTATMQEINNQYEKAIQFVPIEDKDDSTADWMREKEMNSQYRDIINATINLDGVNVELCGLWLWFTGDTKKHKETLKDIGCRWARKKKAWYWKPPSMKFRKKSKKELSMNEIRDYYGSAKVKQDEEDEQKELYSA